MNRTLCVFLIICFLLSVTPCRLPAPIVEEERPTPSPAVEEQPAKRPSKAKRKSSEALEQIKPTEPPKPKERFAGTWTGKISQGLWGNVQFTFTLSAGGTEVTERSSFGTYHRSATSDGRTATWNSGVLNEIIWTFTPNSDGNTAQVTANSPLGVNGSSTFQRGGAPATAKTGNEIPTAKPDPNRPGFVYNPFDPTATRLLDVRGKPSGAKVKDPSTGKTFIVP
jgi:hypothetical protein